MSPMEAFREDDEIDKLLHMSHIWVSAWAQFFSTVLEFHLDILSALKIYAT